MPVFVLDTCTDTAGTPATSHVPPIGGDITPAHAGAAAVVTPDNRFRGDGQGTLAFAALPLSANYAIEASVYCASDVHGFGLSLSGVLLSYSTANGYWNLAGTGVPGGGHADQAFTPGQRVKVKFTCVDRLLTAVVDGVQIIQKTMTQDPPAGPAGVFFLAQDDDATGYHLESFAAYDLAAPGTGTVLERIRENLIDTINTIDTTNGYACDLVAVKRDREGNATGDGVVVVLYGDRTQNPAVQGCQVEEWIQEFLFKVYAVRPPSDDPDYDAINDRYESAIKKAINQDTNRGGLAHDTRANPPAWFQPSGAVHEGVEARCYVRYRTVYGDAYTPR